MRSVAAFSDTYLPTVDGAAYTIAEWRERWTGRGGRMDVVYPRAADRSPGAGEHPVRAVRFPVYPDYRLGIPRIPDAVRDVELVHVHTPFSVGFAGLRLARRAGLPLVASYHTPTTEYVEYLADRPWLTAPLRALGRRWERLVYDRADVVLTPSERTEAHLVSDLGVSARVVVLSNGVNVERFRPVDPSAFLAERGIDPDRPIVGYTGRHGHEKCLHELVEAVAGLDTTLLVGGDGPARRDLEALARETGADARFLGFMDRGDLPAFYSALDVFGFPSPVETEGVVAMEAMACGTPVVGVDAGALADTVAADRTGYHYPPGDVEGFREAIERALEAAPRLREACLERRPSMSVDRTIDRLSDVYDDVA